MIEGLKNLSPKNMSPRAKVFAWIVAGILVVDQWTKYLAIEHLTRAFRPIGGIELDFLDRLRAFLFYQHPPRAVSIAVLEDFWHFRYVENPGAAWGFLASAAGWFRTPFFLLVSVGAMIFIISYFRRSTPEQKMLRVALGLVFAGAVGNFIDRVRLGYVIDFIDWHWYDKATWPTFNIADAGITCGVALLVLDMLLHRQSAVSKEAATEEGPEERS